jgi:hypothetical protein
MKKGSLTVVGSGIKAIAHMSAEAISAIRLADKVLYGACEPLTEDWILRNARSAESLDRFYVQGGLRMSAYQKMIGEITDHVRNGLRICASFEGHPGIFVYVSHESIRLLRSEGYQARMLPGVSTQEALFCDLLVDPGEYGCQSFDATDFLLRGYEPNVTSALILWQLSCIGDFRFWHTPGRQNHIDVLTEVLEKFYGPEHEVIAYQAPMFIISQPTITRTSIANLPNVNVDLATLYVPPLRPPSTDAQLAPLFGL